MRIWYRILWIAARGAAYALFGFRTSGLKNIPLYEGALIVCNHQSYFDPFFVQLALPREPHFMAKSTLFSNPILAKFFRLFNAFPVRRESLDIQAVDETIKRLRDKKLVVIFPEGTRSEDGRLGRIKHGAGAIAKKAGVCIIPLCIKGTREIWPKRAKLPVRLGGRVRIIVGEKIDPKTCQFQNISGIIYDSLKRLLEP
jgi:1-acyl-sn-glycerol-3-phosphate acyltransferase